MERWSTNQCMQLVLYSTSSSDVVSIINECIPHAMVGAYDFTLCMISIAPPEPRTMQYCRYPCLLRPSHMAGLDQLGSVP